MGYSPRGRIESDMTERLHFHFHFQGICPAVGFTGSTAGKESIYKAGDPSSWVGKFPCRRDRLLTPVVMGFLGGSDGKESTCNERDLGLTLGLGRSLGGGHGNPL